MMKNISVISSNPFLAAIEEFLLTESLAERLSTSPLTEIDLPKLGIQERLDLLDRLPEEFFEPTGTSLAIATSLYRLIRKGYINRNPTIPKVRKLTMKIASYGGYELSRLPWNSTNAKGMVIQGITGLGKTYEIERALRLLPQFVEHGRSEAAGWAKMKQVVWLKVGMSHDGSLGGLLFQIFVALDEAIGSDYSQDKNLIRSSNEKLAVRLGIILRNHGVGVLVIDEIQERNFQGHGKGEFAATFFLRMLNFGIPIVLIGNPFGISALYSFSQDVRRIGSGGSFYMHPLDETEYDWCNCLAPAISRLNLLNEPHQVSNLAKQLYYYSGGIRDYALRIMIATQRMALDLGKSHITEELMQLAYIGSDFLEIERAIISGFRNKNPIPLIQFEDIPWEEYSSRWGLYFDGTQFKVADQKATSADPVDLKAEQDPKPVPQKELEMIKRQRTRKVNSKKNKVSVRQNLSQEDIRMQGLQEHLIGGLTAIQPGNNKQV
jgi:hypothetical protein